MKIAIAKIKTQRISVRKVNLVSKLIRKNTVERALEILKNVPKKSSDILLKLLNSAIANAVNNYEMNADNLKIYRLLVDEGPTLKRFQPRGRGRAFPILKRTSNITIELSEKIIKKSKEKKIWVKK